MPLVDEGLNGLRVLVTGGSRGIGEATVRRFAAAGAATVLTASRTAPERELPAAFIPADLRSEQGAAELGRRVVDSVGGVDVLVNNAAAATAPMPTLERTDASWLADLEMNLLGAVRLDRALVPGMVERGSGVVVHVSSIASRLPQPAEASYAAAKAALNAYSRELATEVARTACAWCASYRASSSPTERSAICGGWRTARASGSMTSRSGSWTS